MDLLARSLRRPICRLPSFLSLTPDQVAQLRRDTLIASATICDWVNSFTGIGRVPLDVLVLIPTYLSSQKDRFRASFVCRRWRRTFLQCAELWSELFLSKGEAYVKTLLSRVKGSALDVIVGPRVPVSITALLSSYTKQFRSLRFMRNKSRDIQIFLEVNSGPLPLLRILEIFTTEGNSQETEEDSSETEEHSSEAEEDSLEADGNSQEGSGVITSPSSPLFSNATNLEVFSFHSDSDWSPSLGYFAFPNLTSFLLSVGPGKVCAPQLLDLLEGSPMLRTVHMEIADIELERVPEERVIVLRNVDNFDLTMTDGELLYEFAAHISCPSASFTSFALTRNMTNVILEEVLPFSDSWNAIVHQYTRSPVEEVALEIQHTPTTTCKFAFRSSDGSVIKLCLKATIDDEDNEDKYTYHSRSPPSLSFSWIDGYIYPGVTRIVLDHPEVANVKRLHLSDGFAPVVPGAASELRQLFMALGPLDELTLHNCRLSPYFDSFSGFRKGGIKKKGMFTPIKQLTISHCGCAHLTGIETLAKSQHALGIPFEHIILRNTSRLEEIEDKLRPWVGSVEYRYSSWRELEKSIVD